VFERLEQLKMKDESEKLKSFLKARKNILEVSSRFRSYEESGKTMAAFWKL
jgi:hypothetical protein